MAVIVPYSQDMAGKGQIALRDSDPVRAAANCNFPLPAGSARPGWGGPAERAAGVEVALLNAHLISVPLELLMDGVIFQRSLSWPLEFFITSAPPRR